MFNYFRDNLKIDDSLPNNPFISQGLITVFDPYFNRLIFVKKANTNGFTISYSLEEDIWVSWHDYTPDWLFSTSTNFLGIKNNKVYKFNQEDVISKYFEDSIQYFAAKSKKIKYIITRNIKDYPSGEIKPLSPREFLTIYKK